MVGRFRFLRRSMSPRLGEPGFELLVFDEGSVTFQRMTRGRWFVGPLGPFLPRRVYRASVLTATVEAWHQYPDTFKIRFVSNDGTTDFTVVFENRKYFDRACNTLVGVGFDLGEVGYR